MNAVETARWQAARDGLLQAALNEAVAALDAKDSEGVQVAPDEARALHRMRSENACLLLRKAAESARMARIGEQSTHGSGIG